MRVHTVLVAVSLLLAVTLAQDSSEESPIPKKTLRKYRVRRPVITPQADVAENSRPVTTTRVRRIRIKQRPSEASAIPVALQEQYEQPEELQRHSPSPQPQTQVRVSSQRPQQVFFEEQQVVEPVRTVPQYRTATPTGTRSALLANVNLRDQSRTRGAEDEDRKNVGTTRNYSHLNEDGSFTFGYEGEDGSFKEETRGTDCVVRGKYGYVDPDGVRREFTYVSGNPCDPNDPNKDEAPEDDEADERAVPPTRPLLRRIRPEITQNVLQGLEQTVEERVPDEQLPSYRVSSRPRQQQQANPQPTTSRPRVRVSSTTPAYIRSSEEPAVGQPFAYTARPQQINLPVRDVDNTLPQGRSLFNFQSEVQRITQQAQTQPETQHQFQYQPQVYHQTHAFPTRQVFPAAAPTARTRPAEYRPSGVQATPSPVKVNQVGATIHESQRTERPEYGNYRTELVYDPSTNQYTSVLVQDIPKTNEEFTLTQRLRAFVEPQRPNQFQIQQFGQPTVQYFGNNPQVVEQQRQQTSGFLPQTGLPVRSLQNQANQVQQQLHAEAQQIQPHAISQTQGSGQIDAFLRSLNISA